MNQEYVVLKSGGKYYKMNNFTLIYLLFWVLAYVWYIELKASILLIWKKIW